MDCCNSTDLTTFFNLTKETEPIIDLTGLLYMYRSVTGTVGTLTVFGNTLVILSVVLNHKLHTVLSFSICNLAISDLLSILSIIGGNVFLHYRGMFASLYPCLAIFTPYIFTGTLSSYGLLVVAIDRYVMIIHPLHYPLIMTSCRVSGLLAGTWLSAGFLSLVPFVWNSGSINRCDADTIWSPGFIILYCLVTFILPLTLIYILYFAIFKRALYHLRQIHNDHVLGTISGSKVSPGTNK